ncbi:MAG: hypothetical protein D6806_07180, partial [Deltaproteobacteria bacterium]
MKRMNFRAIDFAVFTILFAFIADAARADSVAQVQTAVRISRQTVQNLDPQWGGTGSTGSDTTAKPGDILTFIVQFTPVPNGATRGLGGYVTVYVPRNTEVVGARIVNGDGETVPPHRGGLAADGVGPRGPIVYDAAAYAPANGCTVDSDCLPGFHCMVPLCVLEQGSMSQLYADTGIFFSTDPRTMRVPAGDQPGEEFITVFNGIPMALEPTGANQFNDLIGALPPYRAHNLWDYTQAL